MEVTYYVAVPFDRDPEGELKPGEAQELPSAAAAERRAGVSETFWCVKSDNENLSMLSKTLSKPVLWPPRRFDFPY